MGIRELREKYNATKPRQAINRAIRAELPGGEQVLELIALFQSSPELKNSNSPDIKTARSLAIEAQSRMSAEIAARYSMALRSS